MTAGLQSPEFSSASLFLKASHGYPPATPGMLGVLYLWGGLIILLSGPGRGALGNTAAWKAFARFLVE